jgi:catechol 2,3-dioxygenase-like lactoylglutathione lyase family enzyme
MHLTEIAYFTDDVKSMVAFYRELLGRDPEAEGPDSASFCVGPTTIFIHRIYTPQQGQLPPEDHHAFTVVDVDTTACRLVEEGLTIETPPRDYYWGRSAYLRDPDGHLIELNQIRDAPVDEESRSG